MATVTEFTVIRGKALEFSILVKENGTTTPLVLNAGDTFKFSLIDKKTNTKYITDKAMTITDAANGTVTGTITAIESADLPMKRAAVEDGYIARPSMRLVVTGDTAAQGEMTAIIEDVYVVVG